jgi:hypothetical protein
MLLNMALATNELDLLADQARRVLRPERLHVYTVRNVDDAHCGAGVSLGDGMYENGGFIVHFFDRALVERLAVGCSILEVHDFDEGALPRRLWRITLRKN